MRVPVGAVRLSRGKAAVVVVITACATSVVMAGVGAAKNPTELMRFTTPGVYSWTVPPKVASVTFDVFGAQGGDVSQSGVPLPTLIATGGDGGEATGTFIVSPGQVFQIVVGGQGGTAVDRTAGAGGFNGGGGGAAGGFYDGSEFPDTDYFGGGGGGGASDVRINNGNACASTLTCGLSDRIVVGGGGGGAGGDPGAPMFGGDGGGLSGSAGDGVNGGGGGTQTAGGEPALPSGSCAGSFGTGGDGHGGNGGGGGGWYGGAAGCTQPKTICGCSGSRGQGSAGGGGSGLIPPTTKKVSFGSFPGGASPSADGAVIITEP
jgi:hypothetical protein